MNSTTTSFPDSDGDSIYSGLMPFILFLGSFLIVYIYSCTRKETCCKKKSQEVDCEVGTYEKAWFLTIEKKPLKSDCAICLSRKSSSKNVAVLPCGHKYHETCLYEWLEEHPNCPMCRASVKTHLQS